jgi:hypothetical protein
MNYLFVTETGAEFTLAIQFLQLFSENKDDFTKITDNLGLYFQIWNDYQNLFGQEVNSELIVSDVTICPCVETSCSEGLWGVVVKPSSLYLLKQKCL